MNRKMLVRAFTKVAKRWEDSKTTPVNIRCYGYKNARDWGREWAKCYSEDMLENFAEWLDVPLNEWDQAEYDCFVEEELSYC